MKIEFEILRNLLTYDTDETSSENRDYMEEIGDNIYQYTLNSHINYINDTVNNLGLSDYISIKTNYRKWRVNEIDYDFFPKYIVVVENLEIETSAHHKQLELYPIPINEKYPSNSRKMIDQYSDFYCLIFKSNKFINADETINCYCQFTLGGNCYISFENNRFDNVDLYLYPTLKFDIVRSVINLENNIFSNRHVSLYYKKINKQSSNVAILKNNDFNEFRIGGSVCYFMMGNSIDNITIKGYIYKLELDKNNKFSTNEKYKQKNKEFLLNAKKISDETYDDNQLDVIDYLLGSFNEDIKKSNTTLKRRISNSDILKIIFALLVVFSVIYLIIVLTDFDIFKNIFPYAFITFILVMLLVYRRTGDLSEENFSKMIELIMNKINK